MLFFQNSVLSIHIWVAGVMLLEVPGAERNPGSILYGSGTTVNVLRCFKPEDASLTPSHGFRKKLLITEE